MKWMNPFKYQLKIHKKNNLEENDVDNENVEYSLVSKEKNIDWGYHSKILFRFNKSKKILQIGKTTILRKEFNIPLFNIKVIKN